MELDAMIYGCDCIAGMREYLKDESIDMTVSSIPFGSLFTYSGKTEDIGNNIDGIDMHEGQFGLHFRFFLNELYRVMKPGSITCIHVQQLLAWKVQHGYMGMRDFRGAIVTLFKNHGFEPHGEVAIPKDPRAVARRLNLHSLMFVTAAKDSRRLAPAMNDYVLFFRKPGEGIASRALIEANREIKLVEPSPIIDYSQKQKKIVSDYKSIPYEIETWNEKVGTQVKTVTGGKHINPDGWITKNDWIKYANGVWDDIQEIDTLDGYKCARETDEERHVCPLQLQVIRRCIKLYSAPGQIVLDPFMGIGSTGYVAIEQGRNAIGFELKESYHDMALRNIEKAKLLFCSDSENGSDKQLQLFA
jgi:DNA modification methylase